MLRIRVLMQPLAGGAAQTISDRPIVSRDAGGNEIELNFIGDTWRVW